MKKSDIRTFLKEVFLQRPTKKWEATLRTIDRALYLAGGVIVTVSAFVTGNLGAFLSLVWLFVLGFIIFYFFIAKGR